MDLLKNLFESANQKKHLVHHPEATPNPETKSVKTTLGQKIHEEYQPVRETKKGVKEGTPNWIYGGPEGSDKA